MTAAEVSAFAATVAAILSFVGVMINVFVTRKHQLSLAAIDRRLEVHQKAYALCAKLLNAIEEYSDDPRFSDDVVDECRYWWLENSLYLNKKPRKKFAHVCCNSDPKSEQLIDVMDALENEMGLPSLSSSVWRKTTSVPAPVSTGPPGIALEA